MPHRYFSRMAVLCLSVSALMQAADISSPDGGLAHVTETKAERDVRMQWWRSARFGMFIHWGLYSGLAGEWKGVPGGAEWIQKNMELDTEEYAAEAIPLFKPKEGFAEEWAKLAEEAGCRYVVLTSKHHDGFALFNTAASDFNAQRFTGRDLVREYVDAMRRHGLRIGFYHSVIDWHHNDYDYTINPDLCYPKRQRFMLEERGVPRNQPAYKSYLHSQVRELLTNYGKIDIIWWDYSQGAAEGERAWNAPALIEMCRHLQPGIIMNNRLYSYSGLKPDAGKAALDLRKGDFLTPEQRIPAEGYPGVDWEACMTVGDKWGYSRFDTNVKSVETLILKLAECTARGGNLLLNINPTASGEVPEAVAKAMRGVGSWLKICGEAIYGAEPAPELPSLPGVAFATQKEDALYLILSPRRDDGGKNGAPRGSGEERRDTVPLQLPASVAGHARPSVLGMPDYVVSVRSEGDAEIFTLPAAAWDRMNNVPILKLTRKP